MSKTIYEVRFLTKYTYSNEQEAKINMDLLRVARREAELWKCETIDGGTKIWSLIDTTNNKKQNGDK